MVAGGRDACGLMGAMFLLFNWSMCTSCCGVAAESVPWNARKRQRRRHERERRVGRSPLAFISSLSRFVNIFAQASAISDSQRAATIKELFQRSREARVRLKVSVDLEHREHLRGSERQTKLQSWQSSSPCSPSSWRPCPVDATLSGLSQRGMQCRKSRLGYVPNVGSLQSHQGLPIPETNRLPCVSHG